MNEYLNEELRIGNEAAKTLAEHLKSMRAAKCTHTYIDDEGEIYTVTVEKNEKPL